MATLPTSFRIEKTVKEEFDRIADKLCINKTKWIESKMKEFIEENKDK